MLLFGLMDAASKYLSARYPTPQIIWLRYVFTIPMVLLVLAPQRHRALAALGQAVAAAARARCLLVLEIGLVVWCFGRMPLADVHALLALTPLAVTALAVPAPGRAGRPAPLGGGGGGLRRRA